MKLLRRPGKLNEADIGTKYLSRPEIDAILKRLGFVTLSGRSPLSLRAAL